MQENNQKKYKITYQRECVQGAPVLLQKNLKNSLKRRTNQGGAREQRT